ncbi:MAG TPA: hypothetical protein VK213_11920 [Bacteroidales bacterium]|nr:hypothetical protein [Bacteroidales bacterium]
MKKYALLIATISGILSFSCSKDEDYLFPDTIMNEMELKAVNHSVYGTDSIIYTDNKVSNIRSYKIQNGAILLDISYRFEYADDEITIHAIRRGFDEDIYTLSFSESGIKTIRSSSGTIDITFYYNEKRQPVYFLYHRMSSSKNIMVDSISVAYDEKQSNITGMTWYRKAAGVPDESVFSFAYTHDDKRNPYSGSVYYLACAWQGPDEIISYFNRNNITSIGKHRLTYGYDSNNYPVFMDVNMFGRTTFFYQEKSVN